jgi:HK97 family phage portal protein
MRLLDWFKPKQDKGMSSLDLFREIYGGRASNSGIEINYSRALEVSTVLACVRVLANGVAQVPFRVMQETATDRRVATEHPLNRLLSLRPNPRQTSFEFRETLMFHLLLTGNAYVWKGKVGRNRQIARLNILEPSSMTVKKLSSGEIEYKYTDMEGAFQVFSSDEIWHLKGPSWNTWSGMDAVKLARDAIGLAIATERTHAERHKNGAQVSGLYSVEGELGVERFKAISAWLDRHAAGGDRAHKALVLDGGARFVPISMTGVDAQHIETRKHQIEEICREFGVMPIMVGHADKTATYASSEQMFLAHVVHGLTPHYERLEQSADANLLSDDDLQAGYYTKFSPNGLMRGAAKDRAAFYTQALGAGGHGTAWMTRNEVRALEDLPPVEGGDEFVTVEPAQPQPVADNEGEAEAE